MKLITEQPKNLLTATKEERQKFLDSFDFLLTDCDGTLWDLVSPFEGVSEVLQSMKENGKRVVYVTNNATRSEQQYDDRFEKYNFNANFKDDVIHPGTAIVDYLRSIDFQGHIYLLGSTVLKNYLTESGFDVIEEDPLAPIDDSLIGLATYTFTPLAQKVSAVIIDFPINLSIKHFYRARSLLNDPECKFIAGVTDTNLPAHQPMLGPGAFVNLLEEASQRKAVVLGKPGAALRDVIVAKYNITDPKRVLFVGDMPEQDVGFGKASGFQTLVVRFKRSEEALLGITNPDQIADYYLPCFADLMTVLSDL